MAVKETSKEMKHKKHKALTKPNYGAFGRNEYAILGAPCDIIRKLSESLIDRLNGSSIYIDETHDKSKSCSPYSVMTKMGNGFEFSASYFWSKNELHHRLSDYNYLLVNGNHYVGKKQIVILHPKKEESLSRKLDRLTDVLCFVSVDGNNEPYAFLNEHVEHCEDIPIVSINDSESIAKLIENNREEVPVKAIVLAGGKSLRMGRDKGKIAYHEQDQRIYLYQLLEECNIESYISCRADQVTELEGYRTISDSYLDLGPYGAIASAFMHDPNAAWMVIPCDLPYLQSDHIQLLMDSRNLNKYATAFLNNITEFPEPLVSIWEPKIYSRMLSFLAQGYSCPRKVLINSNTELIRTEDQKFLTNVNTPEEYDKVVIG